MIMGSFGCHPVETVHDHETALRVPWLGTHVESPSQVTRGLSARLRHRDRRRITPRVKPGMMDAYSVDLRGAPRRWMPEDVPLGTLLRRHRRAGGVPELGPPPSQTRAGAVA